MKLNIALFPCNNYVIATIPLVLNCNIVCSFVMFWSLWMKKFSLAFSWIKKKYEYQIIKQNILKKAGVNFCPWIYHLYPSNVFPFPEEKNIFLSFGRVFFLKTRHQQFPHNDNPMCLFTIYKTPILYFY